MGNILSQLLWLAGRLCCLQHLRMNPALTPTLTRTLTLTRNPECGCYLFTKGFQENTVMKMQFILICLEAFRNVDGRKHQTGFWWHATWSSELGI